MSRARNIKPGFFKNELLVELPFEVRLLFIGLWTMADREGRLEDRPTRIRMELFPADSVDVNAGLQGLHDKGFILRYEAQGAQYIQILAWKKHQNPHVKEQASTIPAPGMHGASMVQEPDKHGSCPADSLIPSSLIPDSKASHAPLPPHTEPPAPAAPTDAGRACLAMRQVGCTRVNPSHPDLLAALAEGVTPEMLTATAAEAIEAGKSSPFAWAIATARSRHADGPAVIGTGHARAGPTPMSRTLQTLHALEAAKNAPGLDHPIDQLRLAKADSA